MNQTEISLPSLDDSQQQSRYEFWSSFECLHFGLPKQSVSFSFIQISFLAQHCQIAWTFIRILQRYCQTAKNPLQYLYACSYRLSLKYLIFYLIRNYQLATIAIPLEAVLKCTKNSTVIDMNFYWCLNLGLKRTKRHSILFVLISKMQKAQNEEL